MMCPRTLKFNKDCDEIRSGQLRFLSLENGIVGMEHLESRLLKPSSPIARRSTKRPLSHRCDELSLLFLLDVYLWFC